MAYEDKLKAVESEARAVADIVRANVEPKLVRFIVPEKEKDRFPDATVQAILSFSEGSAEVAGVQDVLEESALYPRRKTGVALLTTVSSFVDHVKRFKSEHSVIFAETGESPRLRAVYDYDEAGAGKAAYGQHRAVYEFPFSDEFRKWRAIHERPLSQVDFAALLEERINDLIDVPDRAALFVVTQNALRNTQKIASVNQIVALSKGLEITANHQVVNKPNLQDGTNNLVFKETHTDSLGQPINVPGAFVIQIPIFVGGANFQFPVRIRYRLKDGGIKWTLSLYLLDELLRHAINEEAKGAAAEAGVPLFFGAP